MNTQEQDTRRIRVRVRTQGGKMRDGIAVGRMGSQLLIQYTINSGEARERWFTKDRFELQMDQKPTDTLPRYGRRKAPAKKFDEPKCFEDWRKMHNAVAFDSQFNATRKVDYEYLGREADKPYKAVGLLEGTYIVNLETFVA